MPKIVDHDKRRLEILDSAFSLFATSGFHGVSVRQIAKSIGMTTGMLYHYFPSKPELFTALVNVQQQKQISDFHEFLKSNPSGQMALLLFVQQERQSLQDLLSIAIDFHRVHPEIDISNLLNPYEQAISEALSIPLPQAKQLFSTVLGELVRGLLGANFK
jgi:AcrR family transcriptional regulator